MRPFIEISNGHVVAYRGKPAAKIAGAFQTLRDAAGFGPDVTAYTLRHPVATHLHKSDIDNIVGPQKQEFRRTAGDI